jgi:hypothetical protein
MQDLTAAMDTFIKGCQRIHTDHMERHYPNVTPDVIYPRQGKRYIKVVRARADGTQGSVHCFVDTTNGDVLKAAGWSAPAKHARGNVFDDHNGLRHMNEYGPAYLR